VSIQITDREINLRTEGGGYLVRWRVSCKVEGILSCKKDVQVFCMSGCQLADIDCQDDSESGDLS